MTRRAWRRFIGRRVVINLVTGSAVTGVLWHVGRDLLVVKDAELLVAGAPSPTRIDGEAIIERVNVDFAQVAPLGR